MIPGWAAAQQPRFLPGLTVSQAAAGRSTLIATIVAVGVGVVVLLPSLALLYSLVLRGRLDTSAVAAGGAHMPARAMTPGTVAGQRTPRPARMSRSGLVAMLAVGTLAAGVGLLVFADPAWAQGIGAVALLACAVSVFALISDFPTES